MSDDPITKSGDRTIVDAAAELAFTPETITVAPPERGTKFAVLGPGQRLQEINIPPTFPEAAPGTITVADLDSFRQYVKRFGGGATVIFCGTFGAPYARAIFNYSTKDVANWHDFGVRYEFARTHEIDDWLSRDCMYFPQDQFAQFLIDRSHEIIGLGEDGDAMALIEAARGFQATVKMEFERAKNDHDGTVHLHYSETADAKVHGNKDVIIPRQFGVQVAAWPGTTAVLLTADFRYRMKGTAVEMGFRFRRPDMVLEPLFESMIDDSIRGLGYEVYRAAESQVADESVGRAAARRT